MTTTLRIKLFLLLLGALALSACGGEDETVASQPTVALEAAAGTSDVDEPDQLVAGATSPQDVATSTGAEVSEAATAVVEIDGETWTYDLWSCGAIGPEFFNATGSPLGNTPADTEFFLAYEVPAAGDGPDNEYNNVVRLTIGFDTWKAGSLSSPAGDETWGQLDWTRDGNVFTGTATLEHTWGDGFENSPPRQASFVVNCP